MYHRSTFHLIIFFGLWIQACSSESQDAALEKVEKDSEINAEGSEKLEESPTGSDEPISTSNKDKETPKNEQKGKELPNLGVFNQNAIVLTDGKPVPQSEIESTATAKLPSNITGAYLKLEVEKNITSVLKITSDQIKLDPKRLVKIIIEDKIDNFGKLEDLVVLYRGQEEEDSSRQYKAQGFGNLAITTEKNDKGNTEIVIQCNNMGVGEYQVSLLSKKSQDLIVSGELEAKVKDSKVISQNRLNLMAFNLPGDNVDVWVSNQPESTIKMQAEVKQIIDPTISAAERLDPFQTIMLDSFPYTFQAPVKNRYQISIQNPENSVQNHVNIRNTKFQTMPQNGSGYHKLGDNSIYDLFKFGNVFYAATKVGLSYTETPESKWKTVTTADGIGFNQIEGIAVTSGYIALVTKKGISISTDKGQTFRTVSKEEGLPHRTTRAVYGDEELLIAGTRLGFSVSTNLGLSWTTITDPNLLNREVLAVFRKGTNWYAGTFENGAYYSSDSGGSWSSLNATFLQNAKVTKIRPTNDGVMIGSDKGISIQKAEGFLNIANADYGLPNTLVNDLFYHDKEILIATNNGIARSLDEGSTWKLYNRSEGLPEEDITSILKDGEDYYFGTYYGLVKTKDFQDFTVFFKDLGLKSEQEIRHFAKGKDSIILATHQGLSMSPDNGSNWVLRTVYDGLPSKGILSLGIAGDTIIVGTDKGPALSKDGGLTFDAIKSEPELPTMISSISVGESLYLASESGVYSYDILSNTSKKVWEVPELVTPSTLHVLKSNFSSYIVWNSTHIFKCQLDFQCLELTHTDLLGVGSINALTLYETEEAILIGTDQGVYTFDVETKTHNQYQELSDEQINHIAIYKGSQYVSTNSGLFISDETGSNFIKYSIEEGLGSDVAYRSFIVDDIIYVSTSRSLAVGR